MYNNLPLTLLYKKLASVPSRIGASISVPFLSLTIIYIAYISISEPFYPYNNLIHCSFN